MLLALVVAFVVVIGQFDDAQDVRIRGYGYTMVAIQGTYGIVIDERFAGRFLGKHEGESFETWTPSHDDVVAAEELLRVVRPGDAVDAERRDRASSPEDLVSRTWYGAIVDGRRLLFVNGYCAGGLPARPLVPEVVADGGACFWNATIDAEQWEIVTYTENGEA